MKKTALSLSMFVLAILLLVPLASADTISLSLASPVQSGAAGDTLSFTATVTAVSDGLGPVYLVSDSAGITGPSSLNVDDTPFLFNFPFVMSGGDTLTDVLFTVTLPSDLAAGSHTGYFSILGGLDPDSTSVLATADFTIDATSASAVPEPSTYLLMATGLGALLLIGFTRRGSAFGNAA
jgi:hypothetical protein